MSNRKITRSSAVVLLLSWTLACSSNKGEERVETGGAIGAGQGNQAGTKSAGAGGALTSSGGTPGLGSTSLGGSVNAGGTGVGGAGGSVLGGTGGSVLGGTGGSVPDGTGGSIRGGAGAGGSVRGGAGGTIQNGGTATSVSGGGQSPVGGGGANPLGGRGGAASGGAASLGGSSPSAGRSGIGGAPTGGALPTGGTGAAGATNSGVDPASGINGRIVVTVSSSSSGAEARASFFDRPMRMDAFDPFPPALHDLVLQQGGCVLTKAALRACNPPCGANQYCGLGDTCAPAAQVQSVGTISLQGPVNTVSLSPVNSAYSPQNIAVANITPSDLISANASGGAVPAFSLSSLGVTTASIGLPGSASTFQLVDGQDKVLTWTPTPQGTVQLLLNSGWHGAPPASTLVCEAPASAGRLVVPRAIVESYPSETGGAGLLSHTSTVSLLQRQRVTSGGNVLELLVVGYRGVVQPVH